MIFIGIDPGLKGGIACIQADGSLQLFPMPTIGEREYDVYELKRILLEAMGRNTEATDLSDVRNRILLTFERQHALPGQGLTSSLKTGIGYGILLGLVAGLEIPHQVVPAQTWQKALFTGLNTKLDTKEKSEIVAKRLFPSADFRRTERSRKGHDGLYDATCLAYYGKTNYKQNL